MSPSLPTVEPFDHHRGRLPLLRQTSTLRGWAFVSINIAAFAVANAFLYYLGTGTWLDLSPGSYLRSAGTPLMGMLSHPLSVFSYPWMIAVAGLLVAAVMFMPVMTAILYRMWVSVLFVLVVAIVGHAPVLAIFLAGGCALAGGTKWRSDAPFQALLVGLTPGLLYLCVLFYLFLDSPDHVSFPRDWVVLLPFLLAIAASIICGTIVLALARLTRYRPGVNWPIMVVLLAAPMALFYTQIGTEELSYALLADRVDPGSGDALFTNQTVADFRRQVPSTRPAANASDNILADAQRELTRRREQLIADCDRFLERYPHGQRRPTVLWFRAVAPDTCINLPALDLGLIKYDSQPEWSARDVWADLAERYAHAPQGMVALERLAVLALRDGRVNKAAEDIQTVRKFLAKHLDHPDTPKAASGWKVIFTPAVSLPTEGYYRAVLAETEQLLWLVRESNVLKGDPANVEALREYMRLWPFRNVACATLNDLSVRYASTTLADNFRLQAALAVSDDWQRVARLAELAKEVSDAAIVANYELGRLARRLGVEPAWRDKGLKSAQAYFQVLLSAPDSPYSTLARQHLDLLGKPPGPANPSGPSGPPDAPTSPRK